MQRVKQETSALAHKFQEQVCSEGNGCCCSVHPVLRSSLLLDSSSKHNSSTVQWTYNNGHTTVQSTTSSTVQRTSNCTIYNLVRVLQLLHNTAHAAAAQRVLTPAGNGWSEAADPTTCHTGRVCNACGVHGTSAAAHGVCTPVCVCGVC